MVQKAKRPLTATDRLKDSLGMSHELYNLKRIQNTPVIIGNASLGNFGGSAGGSTGPAGNFIKSAGDTMVGPLAFYPATLTIDDNQINVGQNTTGYSSRVIVSPEAGSTDNLITITGAAFAGQILFMQGVATNTLTLIDRTANQTDWALSTVYALGDIVDNNSVAYSCKQAHTSSATDEPGVGANWKDFWYKGNIETIDGNNFTLADDDILLFQYDTTDEAWQQITTGKQSVAGMGPPFDDNQVIIQDEADNSKTLTFNLSLQDTGAANLLSWAAGASRTHTFSATTGTIAQLNLAQTWTAEQRINSQVAIGAAAVTAGKQLAITIPDDTNGQGLIIQNSDGSIQLTNNSTTPNEFNPTIRGFIAGTAAAASTVHLDALITPADDSNSTPMFTLRAFQNDATPITTKPILNIQNFGTILWSIDNDGTVDMKDNNLEGTGAVLPNDDNDVSLGSASLSYANGFIRRLAFNGTTARSAGDDNFYIHRDTDGMTFQLGLEGTVEFGKFRWADKDDADRVVWDWNSTVKNYQFNFATGGFKIRQNAADTDALLLYPTGNSFSANDVVIDAPHVFGAGEGILFRRTSTNKMRLAEDIFMFDDVQMGANRILSVGDMTAATDSTYDIASNAVRFKDIYCDSMITPNVGEGALHGTAINFSATGMLAFVASGDSITFTIDSGADYIFNEGALSLDGGTDIILASGYVQIGETTDPAAGTNSGKYYVKDVGGVSKPFFIGDGQAAVDLTAGGGGGANTALSNLASVSVNADLDPSADATRDLGTDGTHWKDLWVETIKNNAGASGQNSIDMDAAGDIDFEVDGSVGMYIATNKNIGFESDSILRAGFVVGSKKIGFQVTDDNITIGTSGHLQIPVDSGTLPGSVAAIDADFGNGVGCIGLYQNSGTPLLCIKNGSSEWTIITLPDAATNVTSDQVT